MTSVRDSEQLKFILVEYEYALTHIFKILYCKNVAFELNKKITKRNTVITNYAEFIGTRIHIMINYVNTSQYLQPVQFNGIVKYSIHRIE